MNQSPKISVLMPAYNAEKYIGDAIESILNQSFTDFEFIIIDDCSTDCTWEIIQEYAKKDERIVSVKNNENLKISKTLNRGIRLAKGKYIARMDADDWSYPDRLQKQIKYMDSNPQVGISGGSMEVCDNNLKKISSRTYNLKDEEIRKNIFRYSPFSHPLVIYRSDIIKNINYNTYLYDAEDYDLYFRIGLEGKFGNIKDNLLKLRVNSQSVSQTNASRQEKLTLFIRLKAIIEYAYKPTLIDIAYSLLQYISTFLIPNKIKFWIFNYLRK